MTLDPKDRRLQRWLLPALYGCAIAAWAQSPAELPAGMSFVARDAAGAWALYFVDQRHQAQRVATQLEPRQACVAADGSKAVYSAADGTLRVALPAGGSETVIARPDARRSYTQPCLDSGGRDVVAVEMADGKSLETEILRFGSAAEPERIARQPGAQHDPFLHQGRWLVYASVGCSDGCDELLVEIWGRDLLAGKARQLTLLNALSQGPVTDGRHVVFSSNASGSHQLWQVGIDGNGLRRLTDGPAQAIHPALCGGELYFVKSGPDRTVLARRSGDGSVAELPLPGLEAVRALRCLS
ncbi:MAG: hypothetical protein JNL87_08640 [Burkholderiaceae bacterium]|nr:hypothetical protein [Burkholderiaceae bacterium]